MLISECFLKAIKVNSPSENTDDVLAHYKNLCVDPNGSLFVALVNSDGSLTENSDVILAASAARTVSFNSLTKAHNGRGGHFIINVSSITSSPSVVPTIQGYDSIANVYYDLLIGSAITATGTTVLKIYPGISPLSNAAANDILPKQYRLKITHANGDSITYSANALLVV